MPYRFPAARIVISGGDGALIYTSMSEAGVAKRFFTRIGIDAARITAGGQIAHHLGERGLHQEATDRPQPGERWLLVTSAFHMPRAMGCFRAAGFDVTPWPVDFRTRGPEDLMRLFAAARPTAWRRIDLAAKEWIGLLAYWLAGRI